MESMEELSDTWHPKEEQFFSALSFQRQVFSAPEQYVSLYTGEADGD